MFLYIYFKINLSKSFLNFKPTKMLYDTYGEEYLVFLQDLNEILSINELAELDYM